MGAARDPEGRFARGQPIDPARLRHAREAAGLTIAEAAAGIVSHQALSQFELGQARPRRATIEALAKRLDISVDVVLARPRDSREAAMRELEAQRQWPELERLAMSTLADLNLTPRMQAVARFYLGRATLSQDPSEALVTLRVAGQQLARLREPWLAAEALDWQAVALYYLQDLSAVDVGRQALARYRLLADREPAVESRMLEHIAACLLQRQEVPEAVRTYHAAIDVADGGLNLGRLALIYHGLASGCLRLGDVRQALDYFNRAVAFARADHDYRGAVSAELARLENDYGHALVRVGRLDLAEEMILAAIEHFDAAGVRTAKTHALLSMGDLRRQQGQVEDAMSWTEQAIELADELGEVVSLAGAYQQLGELFALQGNEDRFEASFARAIELTADLPERRAEALARYRRVRDVLSAKPAGA